MKTNKNHGKGALVALVAMLALVGATALAEGNAYLPDHVGKWSYKFNTDTLGSSLGMTPPEVEAFKTGMQAVAEVFHESPTLNPPKGIDADARTDAVCGFASCVGKRVMGKVDIGLVDLVKTDAGKIERGEASVKAVEVFTNDLETISFHYELSSNRFEDDKGNLIFYQPRKLKEVGGYPLYDNGRVVIAKPGKPIWVPVTNEQYLKIFLKQMKEGHDKMMKDLPPGFKIEGGDVMGEVIKKREAELAGLSPEKRKAPAYYCSGAEVWPVSAIVDKSEECAQMLVTPNPDYFDKALPRTAIQLIIVSFDDIPHYEFNVPGPEEGPAIAREFEVLNNLNYKKLAGMVKTTKGEPSR